MSSDLNTSVPRGFGIAGAVAVVTGAGSGIGAALVHELARRGAAVVIVTDLDAAAAQHCADAVNGCDTEAHGLDVADGGALRSLLVDVERRHGRIDLMCSNAGIGTGYGVDAPLAMWQQAWDVNLMAHVHAAATVIPGMLARGRGALLHTCSAAGLLTVAGDAPYAVTKHAAVALAEWLSLTYGDRGLTVTALCPLGVETAMLTAAEDHIATRFVRATGRVLPAEDVAIAALDALGAGRVVALPHPEVAHIEQARALDHDGWLARVRSALSTLEAGTGA
jgi:NAD(P)-dependent dehydrogenase (short-subunit alcohol dehydrogenase family)